MLVAGLSATCPGCRAAGAAPQPELRPPSQLDVTQGGSLCPWMQEDALVLLCKSDGKVPPKGFVLSCSCRGTVMLGCISTRNQPEKPGSTRDTGDRSHSGGGIYWHSSLLEQ